MRGLMERNARLEELGDRLFKQSLDSIFGYKFDKEVANMKERFAYAGTLRSSLFAWAVADAILSGLRSMRKAFLESYLRPTEESGGGLTDERLAWLRDKLEARWEPEILNAKGRLCAVCESIGLASKEVQPQAGRVEVEGRSIKVSVLGDLDIAALCRSESGSGLSGQKLSEDFSFVQDLRMRSILARDYAELGTLDSAIHSKAALILSGA